MGYCGVMEIVMCDVCEFVNCLVIENCFFCNWWSDFGNVYVDFVCEWLCKLMVEMGENFGLC